MKDKNYLNNGWLDIFCIEWVTRYNYTLKKYIEHKDKENNFRYALANSIKISRAQLKYKKT